MIMSVTLDIGIFGTSAAPHTWTPITSLVTSRMISCRVPGAKTNCCTCKWGAKVRLGQLWFRRCTCMDISKFFKRCWIIGQKKGFRNHYDHVGLTPKLCPSSLALICPSTAFWISPPPLLLSRAQRVNIVPWKIKCNACCLARFLASRQPVVFIWQASEQVLAVRALCFELEQHSNLLIAR